MNTHLLDGEAIDNKTWLAHEKNTGFLTNSRGKVSMKEITIEEQPQCDSGDLLDHLDGCFLSKNAFEAGSIRVPRETRIEN